MADLDASLAPQIVEACGTNASDIAEALGRALDAEVVVKAGAPADPAADTLTGGGLALAFTFGERGLVATLPAESGLVPDWAKSPDPTGESKLSTLAQELSMLVVPDDLMADDFSAAWVEDLAAAVERSQPDGDALALPLEVACGEKLGVLRLLWPVDEPNTAVAPPSGEEADPVVEAAPPTEEPTTKSVGAEPSEPAKPTARVLRGYPPPQDFRDLPPNVVSMLQIGAPVSATLANKKVTIGEIVELGPGSIITFDKPCDAMLELSVAGQPIAEGEAVKVGERFGVRIQQMILPDERFRTMLPIEAQAESA